MAKLHLFATEDGESHLKTTVLDALARWAASGVSVTFREGKTGFTDFHNSALPHILLVLSGQMELKASDGSSHLFVAGDCLFSEDLTGKGHAATVSDRTPFEIAILTPLAA